MSPLLDQPSLWLFFLHFIWIALFVLGSHRLCLHLTGMQDDWSYAPVSFVLLAGGLIYTIQSTAVALTGRILPPAVFWVVPLLGILSAVASWGV